MTSVLAITPSRMTRNVFTRNAFILQILSQEVVSVLART